MTNERDQCAQRPLSRAASGSGAQYQHGEISHKHTIALTKAHATASASALTSRACIWTPARWGIAYRPSPLVLLHLLLAAAAAAALSTTPPNARPQFITPRQRGEPQ